MVIYFNQTTIPEGMKATEAGMHIQRQKRHKGAIIRQ